MHFSDYMHNGNKRIVSFIPESGKTYPYKAVETTVDVDSGNYLFYHTDFYDAVDDIDKTKKYLITNSWALYTQRRVSDPNVRYIPRFFLISDYASQTKESIFDEYLWIDKYSGAVVDPNHIDTMFDDSKMILLKEKYNKIMLDIGNIISTPRLIIGRKILPAYIEIYGDYDLNTNTPYVTKKNTLLHTCEETQKYSLFGLGKHQFNVRPVVELVTYDSSISVFLQEFAAIFSNSGVTLSTDVNNITTCDIQISSVAFRDMYTRMMKSTFRMFESYTEDLFGVYDSLPEGEDIF